MSSQLLHFQNMRQVVEGWVPLSDTLWARFNDLFETQELAAKQDFSLPGDEAHSIAFVGQGLLRIYYLNAEGKESNKTFVQEDQFAAPLTVAALGLPLHYGIQALEPTTLLVARYRDFVALFEEDPSFDRLGRKLAENLLMRKVLRERSLLLKKATERYLDFAQDHPSLNQRVPQYHIASYLGITEVSLSRLRANLNKLPLSQSQNLPLKQ